MNDIALLKLDREAEYNDYVQPICLPWWDDHEDYTLNTFAGRKTIIEVAGWGATLKNGARPADILQFLKVPIFEQNRCKETYKDQGATLEEKQLCAGGVAGRDSCLGDSGSGLMRKVKIPDDALGKRLRSQLIGVVSFGPRPCGQRDVPGVYARVNSSRVNKKPQKFIFEYWVFSQKSYFNVGCFEEIHICIPKIRYLHTS